MNRLDTARRESRATRKIAVSFQNFSFKYFSQKHPTLYDINLDIYEGEKVVIIGPSGSGKSTLARCLNGLCPFSYEGDVQGTLSIAGNLSASSSVADRSQVIGTVLQDTDAQFVGLNVAEDIAFSLENSNTPLSTMRKKVAQVSKQVELMNHLDHAPQQLSGGQKQRATLGGVLVDQVDILLFDEPLANLDPYTGMYAIEIIDKLCREDGKTVIIIEHRLEDALYCTADRIVLIDDGWIVADQTPDSMLCSGILAEHGLREPLVLSLFRYAGIELKPTVDGRGEGSDTPSAAISDLGKGGSLSPPSTMPPIDVRLANNSRSFKLSAAEKQRLTDWFNNTPTPTSPVSRKQEAVEFYNVSFSYNGIQTVLNNISFKVYEGEIIALVGKNGAGKTTAAKLICGFETPTSGKIRIMRHNVVFDSIQERANSVGYVMQNPNHMLTEQIVSKEVSLGLRLRGVDKSEIERRLDETLRICGLSRYREYPIAALSYGQKKRLTIASILILNPRVIILDEPTAGQDYRHYHEIMEFLRALHRDLGLTIILITHDMHLMLEYAHRAIVLSDGVLLADRPTVEVLTDSVLSERANLKETALYHIAKQIDVSPWKLTRRFVEQERSRSAHKPSAHKPSAHKPSAHKPNVHASSTPRNTSNQKTRARSN